MDYRDILKKEIDELLIKLENMDVASKEYADGITLLNQLVDKAVDVEKLMLEQNKKEKLEKSESWYRWAQIGVSALGVVVPVLATIWGTVKSLQFEQEGTITTIMGRGFITKLLPKGK